MNDVEHSGVILSGIHREGLPRGARRQCTLQTPGCAGGAGGQALEDAHERLFVAFRLQRKRALAAAVARLEVALQEDAALAELEALEGAGEEVPPPPPPPPAGWGIACSCVCVPALNASLLAFAFLLLVGLAFLGTSSSHLLQSGS